MRRTLGAELEIGCARTSRGVGEAAIMEGSVQAELPRSPLQTWPTTGNLSEGANDPLKKFWGRVLSEKSFSNSIRRQNFFLNLYAASVEMFSIPKCSKQTFSPTQRNNNF